LRIDQEFSRANPYPLLGSIYTNTLIACIFITVVKTGHSRVHFLKKFPVFDNEEPPLLNAMILSNTNKATLIDDESVKVAELK